MREWNAHGRAPKSGWKVGKDWKMYFTFCQKSMSQCRWNFFSLPIGENLVFRVGRDENRVKIEKFELKIIRKPANSSPNWKFETLFLGHEGRGGKFFFAIDFLSLRERIFPAQEENSSLSPHSHAFNASRCLFLFLLMFTPFSNMYFLRISLLSHYF